MTTSTTSTAIPSPALQRALELFKPARRPARLVLTDGYLDLLGARDPTGSHPGQRLMVTRTLPIVYERAWRPLGGRLLMGVVGPGMDDERRLALQMLGLSGGESVLDVGCGPGNFTRGFAEAVGGGGLVVGLDASRTMLARAASETADAKVAYVRDDACTLPFRDGVFDAVCCFAALYLIEEPMRAIAEIVRVLVPGGRVALLASCNRGPVSTHLTSALVRGITGVRVFGREELTGALLDRGLDDVDRRVWGVAQFVSGRKPADGA